MLTTPNPAARSDQALSLNMKLLSQHELAGFGGLGEGTAMQIAKDGRRILWLAHESAPKNFTGVDVTDPKNPKLVVQTELPHMKVRSNSLDVAGEILWCRLMREPEDAAAVFGDLHRGAFAQTAEAGQFVLRQQLHVQ